MRRLLSAALVTVTVAIAWVAALPSPSARQPIVFPHAKHQAIGCAVCHSGAATATRAGLPDAPLCAKCHATAPAGTGAAWERGIARRSFMWAATTQRVPEHVLFSHRRHVTLGRLQCESCHGDMKTRSAPPTVAPARLVMNTCLGCHRREGAAEDCDACHR